MRFMAWNVAFSAWLIVSTFAFQQSGTSFLLCWITALVVSIVSAASPVKTDLRFVISILSFLLFWGAFLLPDVSWGARISNAIVGALLFALALVRPSSSKPKEAPAQPGATG
jgi:hypothetical protein